MRALTTLTVTEARMYLRDPSNVFFALAFPTVLLLLLGRVIPGMLEPITDQGPAFAGLRAIDLFAPIVLALAMGTVSLTTFPAVFGSYREKGVLRRLSTTPVPASRVLVAQVAINVAALVVAVVLALVAGGLMLSLAAPEQPLVVAGSFLLGAVQMIALGCLIAALVPNTAVANGVGMLLYFPMLFFAGVWMPGPMMPETLARISGFTPLGAASQAMTEGWFGTGLPAQQLLVMGAWTVLLIPLAAKLFRWR
ncbi:ABC transporter permease [Actinotalea subterranea]|uniref:ABC transporter permease n=1 Tax=Actinotalea subterranea TaxID=2607497 RepID=UPI0011ED398B|nr:ABC transporter permease [Actinotalea subterranea]